MKKIVLILLVSCFATATFGQALLPNAEGIGMKNYRICDTQEWWKKMIDDGFYVFAGVVVPSSQAYLPLGVTNISNEKFGVGPHLEIGNMFTITDINNTHAIGLRATWFAASMSSFSDTVFDASYLQGSVLRVGPYFTLAIGKNMAIDAYYQIGGSYAWNFKQDTLPSGRGNTGYAGVTHNMGLDFRYEMYTIGFDFSTGNLKYTDNMEYDGLPDDLINDFYKIRTTYTRIYLGFRF